MSWGRMTPIQVLISDSCAIRMKWLTISAVSGTMKLARIRYHSTVRPGNRNCDRA
ncbi:hypothetical protein D3C78_1902390 [compost metagenome]